MAAAGHCGFAYELVVTAGGLRLRPKTFVPGAERIALDVAERFCSGRDDELIHVGMLEIAADQFILFIGVTPPAHHFRRLQPAPDHRQMSPRYRMEGVSGRHWPSASQRLDGHVA